MDDDFFKQLEDSISNVGTDEVWMEEIGSRRVWLSPISFTGQSKVQEALNSTDLGSNVISESKRITLSNAIVGIDDMDLRPYRHSGAVFGPLDFPGGKKLKVDLPTYIYMKMVNWGQQFIDDAFSVFADRMESHGKKNVKDIKFDNAKHPSEELGELMVRITELRIQLGLPRLVEEGEKKPEEHEQYVAEIKSRKVPEEPSSETPPPVESFDPFKRVVDQPPQVQRSSPVQQPSFPREPDPVPVVTVPVANAQKLMSRAQAFAEMENHVPTSTPQNPFVASPSVPSDVIEPQIRNTAPVAPPVIDRVNLNRNPRFNPPR